MRSNSLYSGRILCDEDTWNPAADKALAIALSCFGFTKENRRQTATDFTPVRATACTTRAISLRPGDNKTRPSESTLSANPNLRDCGTKGSDFFTIRS